MVADDPVTDMREIMNEVHVFQLNFLYQIEISFVGQATGQHHGIWTAHHPARLLHSLNPAAVWLSAGYETWP